MLAKNAQSIIATNAQIHLKTLIFVSGATQVSIMIMECVDLVKRVVTRNSVSNVLGVMENVPNAGVDRDLSMVYATSVQMKKVVICAMTANVKNARIRSI